MPLQPEQIDNLRVVSGNLEYFNGSSWVQLNDQAGSPPPIGSIMIGMFLSTPSNYLQLNRATLSKTTYSELWDYAYNNDLLASGTNPADSEGNIIQFIDVDSSNFKLPDFRGLNPVVAGVNSFLQAGNGASLQAGMAAYQKWMMQGHYTRNYENGYSEARSGGSDSGHLVYSDAAGNVVNAATYTLGVIISDGVNGTPQTGGYTRGPGFGIGAYIRYQ